MARGTCWVGYEQKGMKMKNGRQVPNCVRAGAKKGDMIKKPKKAYTGKAIRQPTETDTEFEIRHEYHTPFKGPQKAFMGLAVQAASKSDNVKLPSLIGIGADKLLKKSQTARDVTGNLGVGGKLISNYYNNKESDKRNAQAPKEEVTFDRLKKGGIAKGCGKVMNDRRKVTKMY